VTSGIQAPCEYMGQGPGYPLPVPCRISATAEKGLRWSKIHTSQRKSERGRDRGRRGGRRARGGRARMESRTREHPRGGEGAGGVGGMEGGNKQIGYRLGEALMLSQGTCIAGKAGETSLGDGEDCAALECRCKVRSPKTEALQEMGKGAGCHNIPDGKAQTRTSTSQWERRLRMQSKWNCGGRQAVPVTQRESFDRVPHTQQDKQRKSVQLHAEDGGSLRRQ